MKFIAHRINTVKELIQVPKKYGVEIDARDQYNNIILNHDPFKEGENIDVFLQNFQHDTLIINIKSEGIEYKIMEILSKYKINNYFFLDSSFPMIYKLSKKGIRNFALRLSEFESISDTFKFKRLVDWIWVDCFTKWSLPYKEYKSLSDLEYKICVVSPDLLGRELDISEYKRIIKKENISPSAICTKVQNIKKWLEN